MKRLLQILFAALLNVAAASAYDVKIDGIWYNLTSKTQIAEVTYGEEAYVGEVTIPATFNHQGKEYTVTSIGQDAFGLCTDLTAVSIPETVESIGVRAFYQCEKLVEIIIPDKVKTIANSAFQNCICLKNAVLMEGLESIGAHAFAHCSDLEAITLPESVTSIGEYNQEIKGETNVEIIPLSA